MGSAKDLETLDRPLEVSAAGVHAAQRDLVAKHQITHQRRWRDRGRGRRYVSQVRRHVAG